MSAATAIDRKLVEQIVRQVVLERIGGPPDKPDLVVTVSARHVHLTERDVAALFGAGAAAAAGTSTADTKRTTTMTAPKRRIEGLDIARSFRIGCPFRSAIGSSEARFLAEARFPGLCTSVHNDVPDGLLFPQVQEVFDTRAPVCYYTTMLKELLPQATPYSYLGGDNPPSA